MAYRIFTDATSDLNEDLLIGLPRVDVIPMGIVLDGQPRVYGLNEELSTEELYRELRNGKFARTSQANPAVFYSYFKDALEKGEDVLYLGVSSGISGTVSGAKWVAEDLITKYPDRKIICIDTLCAALGEGFLVCEAAVRQAEGYTLEELSEWVEENKLKVCHWFTVDTFTHLKYGGRVSAATAAIGTTLNIKPLLHVTEEGVLQVKEKPRGSKQAMRVQIKKIEEGWQPELGKRIIVGHADNIERAKELKEKIVEKHPDAYVQISEIGAIIGSHVGPDMLAVLYWGSNR